MSGSTWLDYSQQSRARLQFEVSEQPGIVAQLPVPLAEFLQQALVSHKYALSINEENTDILFNTSQLLVSLAESIEEDTDPWELDQSLPAGLLHQALEMLDACFSRQSMRFEEQRQAWDEQQEESGGVSLDDTTAPSPSSAAASIGEQSATVESAVTPEDLVDTLRATLTALTQLVSLDPSSAIPTISSMAESLLTSKFPQCTSLLPSDSQPPAVQETLLQQSSLTASISSAEYAASLISAETYISRLSTFDSLDLSSTEAQCTYADALVEAVAAITSQPSTVREGDILALLAKARDLYSSAIQVLSAPPPQAKGVLTLTPKVDQTTSRLLAGALEAAADAAMLLHVLTGEGAGEAQSVYTRAGKAYELADDAKAAGKVSVRMRAAGAVLGGAMMKPSTGEERGVLRSMFDEGLLRGPQWESALR